MGFSEKVGLVSINRDQMPWLSKAKKSEIEQETQKRVPFRPLLFCLQRTQQLTELATTGSWRTLQHARVRSSTRTDRRSTDSLPPCSSTRRSLRPM